MAPCRCVVSFTDVEGIQHEISVYAGSVYEAVGEAIQQFRTDGIAKALPGALTEFTIAVHRQPVTHKLKLRQVSSWAEGGGKKPAGHASACPYPATSGKQEPGVALPYMWPLPA